MSDDVSYDAPTEVGTRDRPWWIETTDAAIGRRPSFEPAVGRSGGPAGNLRLTAWLGLILLVLLLAEAVTLLDVRGLLSWHAAIGTAVGALVVAKTASTGWRMIRYYRGNRPYRTAGPPPVFFRLLGPLLVASALTVVGTGLALVLLDRSAVHRPLVTFLGQRVDAVTLHQATFIVFAVAVGLHFLGRIVPAVQRVTERVAVPGATGRATALGLTAAAAVLGVLLVVPLTAGWR